MLKCACRLLVGYAALLIAAVAQAVGEHALVVMHRDPRVGRSKRAQIDAGACQHEGVAHAKLCCDLQQDGAHRAGNVVPEQACTLAH